MTEKELEELLSHNPYLRVQETKKAAVKEQHPKGEFDSREEELFYNGYIVPRLLAGELAEGERAESYVLYPKARLQGKSFRAIRYTPDFQLTDKDGKVTIVEIKGRQIRRWQRDYPLRKRIFVEKYCVPNGWEFWEIPAEEVREGSYERKSETKPQQKGAESYTGDYR